MTAYDTLRFALRAMRDNKLRSALTMLGVVIGVSAVVTAVAVGQGASARVLSSVGQLGNNLLTLVPGNPRVTFGPPGTGGGVQTLKLADAAAIRERCERTVAELCPQVRSSVVVKAGAKNWRSTLTGAPASYLSVNNLAVERGRPLTPADEDSRSRVVVIGKTVALNLFGDRDAACVGREIAVNRARFRIVGVLQAKGANTFGQDQDDAVWMPLSTAMGRVLNQRHLSLISIQCRSMETIDLAQEQITSLLRRRHRLLPPYPENDDFSVLSQAQLLTVFRTVGTVFTLLLAGIAAISLTVGGVGIMNIMLVSVTERTREIGIRKALGATEANIRAQFLLEAALLSLAGGLVGMLLGGSVSWIAGRFTGWPIAPTLVSVVIAVGVSVSIGIFFGFWPARKAAQLHPIEALRRE
jgi:putative ABC transport system permease protein